MSIFLDTFGLYAVFDKDDSNHSVAAASWSEWLRNGETLLTNNYVLLETLALLQHRLGIAAVRAFHENVTPVLHIEWISTARNEAAVEAMLAASRRKLSVVDCASFQTMRHHGLRAVFTFDQHFREQGFQVLP